MENKEQKLDDFMKNVFKEEFLETPPDGFTYNVMSKINTLDTVSEVTSYKPLISKTVWVVLGCLSVGLVLLVVYGNIGLNLNWLPVKLKDSAGIAAVFEKVGTLNLGSTTVYSMVAVLLIIYVQIYMLKRMIDRRFSVQ